MENSLFVVQMMGKYAEIDSNFPFFDLIKIISSEIEFLIWVDFEMINSESLLSILVRYEWRTEFQILMLSHKSVEAFDIDFLFSTQNLLHGSVEQLFFSIHLSQVNVLSDRRIQRTTSDQSHSCV